MKSKTFSLGGIILATLLTMQTQPAQAGADPFIGEIMWVGFNFCPRGWADANGQLLPIAQNNALFALYGTIYGGDGRTTFALPDMRSRVSIHTGQGAGLSNYVQGSTGGAESVTLNQAQMPSHSHSVNASAGRSDKNAAGSIMGSGGRIYDSPLAASTTMDGSAISSAGGGQGHENRPPYLTLRACVALVGIFPSRE
jgi:microcystin-dependent protein